MRRGTGTRPWVRTAVLAIFACLLLPATALAVVAPLQAQGPLSPVLARLAKPQVQALSAVRQAQAIGVAPSGPGSLIHRGDGRVLAYVRFDRGAVAAQPALQSVGAKVVGASSRYQTVTAAIAAADLHAVASVPGVEAVFPVRAPVLHVVNCNGGSVISEGVTQLNVEKAREEFPVDGEGLTVGVLSDSFDQATEAATGGKLAATRQKDEETADLTGPKNTCTGQKEEVNVLRPFEPESLGEEAEAFDEGRAMLQVVHDIAPQAKLAFNSAFNGEPEFAEGIEDLAKTGLGGGNADVIVDDVSYFEEPFFQDGPVAAAVNKVTKAGVPYLSAAGNDNLFDAEGNEIASWEAPEYRDSGECPGAVRELSSLNPHHCLDFNPGAPTDRTFGIKVEPHEVLSVDLQWAEPWFGVETNLDAFLLDSNGHLVATSTESNAQTHEPVEIVQWANNSPSEKTVQLVVNRRAGSASPRLKFILLQNGGGVTGVEYPKSGGGDVVGPSIYGHAAAASAIAVGAVPFNDSSEPEFYSSRGPVAHYFGPVEGKNPAETLSAPEEISKPDVAATDCGRTTFFAEETAKGVWRFCGTSEAAPHTAGVAALMLEEEPGASPAEIREALIESGSEVGSFGSCAVGGGLVEALGAMEAITAGPPFTPAEECEPPESPPGEVFVAPGDWGSEEPVTPPPPTPTPVPPTPQPLPPVTRIVKHPAKTVRTRSRTARVVFRFGADQAGISFLCKVDGGAFRACSGRFVHRFGLGAHVVRVKAVGSTGLADSTPAVFRFRVKHVD